MRYASVLLAACALLLLQGAFGARELQQFSNTTRVAITSCPKLSCSPFGWTTLKNCTWSYPQEICCGEAQCRAHVREGGGG